MSRQFTTEELSASKTFLSLVRVKKSARESPNSLLTGVIAFWTQSNAATCTSLAVANATSVGSIVFIFLWRYYKHVIIDFYVRRLRDGHVVLCPGKG